MSESGSHNVLRSRLLNYDRGGKMGIEDEPLSQLELALLRIGERSSDGLSGESILNCTLSNCITCPIVIARFRKRVTIARHIRSK